MKLRPQINQSIPEEIQAARITQAARIRRNKNSEKRVEKIFAAMEKLDQIKKGESTLAINRESNKQYVKVRVSASLAAKLTGKN